MAVFREKPYSNYNFLVDLGVGDSSGVKAASPKSSCRRRPLMSFSTDPATKRNPGSGKSLAASTMAISFSSVESSGRLILIHGGAMCSTAM